LLLRLLSQIPRIIRILTETPNQMRLYINIDHVATIRQARRTTEPDPVEAALAAERAGGDGITVHLREDRRHIQDDDLARLVAAAATVVNLEIACTAEMLRIAEGSGAHQVTFVPERREEVTTEGGLNLSAAPAELAAGIRRLNECGIRTSLFIDPDVEAVARSRDLGAIAIELHTGAWSHDPSAANLRALASSAAAGAGSGLAVHAGHGLTTTNVGPVAAIAAVEELNIGHHIISRSVMIGIGDAVKEMRAAIDAACGGH
jgi:pyridoxine 5-phosphate synthase